jgi:hypothetical protein
MRRALVVAAVGVLFGACSLLGPTDADLVGGADPDASVGGGSGGVAGSTGGTTSGGAAGVGAAGAAGSAGAATGGTAGSGGTGATGGASGAGGAGASGGAAGAGGTSSVPTQGLYLWLRADAGVTESNGAVSSWADQSGNGNDGTQAFASSRPVLAANSLNGLPALSFDGADDYLVLPVKSQDFSAGLTFFAAVRSEQGNLCPPVIQFSNGEEIDDISFQRDGTESFGYEVVSDYQATPSNTFTFDAINILAVLHSPQGAATLAMQGQASGGGQMSLPEVKVRGQNFVAKGLYAGCGFHKGLIAEILLYQRELSTSEYQQVTQYLKTKWGCCA